LLDNGSTGGLLEIHLHGSCSHNLRKPDRFWKVGKDILSRDNVRKERTNADL